MEETKKRLDEEIVAAFECLKRLTPDDENYTEAAKNLETLIKLRAEMEEKTDEKSEKRKDRFIKIGLEVLGIGAPLVFCGRWMKKGFQFEKEGTFTSDTFKWLVRLFRIRK